VVQPLQDQLTLTTGNEGVPIQLAQCRFTGLAININAKMVKNKYIFQIKYTEAILSETAMV